MSRFSPSLWIQPRVRLIRVVIVALCAAAVLGRAPDASAGVRAAAVAPPATVDYHLDILFTQGPTAGNTLTGQVVGTRDGAGAIRATFAGATGLTGTVTGTLISGTAPMGAADTAVSLSVRGTVGAFTLNGHATGAAGSGAYGGTVTQSGLSAGSYLLTPEPIAASYQFAAKIRVGHRKGTTLSGTLTIASESSGRFDGALTLDDGAIYPATGQAPLGNLDVQLYVPGQGLIVGVAPKTVQIILGTTYAIYTGTFVGPSAGDGGAWSATPST